MKITSDKSGTLGQACCFAIVAQVIVMLASSLIFDSCLSVSFLICIMGHWLTVVAIRTRRGKNPTKTDLVMARSGFMLYWIMLFFGMLMHTLVRR